MLSLRLNRPGRQSAGLMTPERLDAAATTAREVLVSPSISVKSWLTKHFSTSPPSLLRLDAMELSSSMKTGNLQE